MVWYSSGNVIARNRVVRGRYALHTMYAHKNHVEDNEFLENMTGIFLMYSDGVEIRRNRILGAQGATGMGVGFKESSTSCSRTTTSCTAPRASCSTFRPTSPARRTASSGTAWPTTASACCSTTTGRATSSATTEFLGNFTQVAVHGGAGATRNVWEGNYWDDYEGFDRDGDGRGDTPYELRAYADRIWMEVPAAAFFRGSPLMEVIDFLDRLAPFSAPTVILRDEHPRFDRPPAPRTAAAPAPGPS